MLVTPFDSVDERDREESTLTRASLVSISAEKAKMASSSQDMHDQVY